MSWKLTKSKHILHQYRLSSLSFLKELKETHLAPLANTFSRSSSTSTIVSDNAPKPPSTSSSTTLVDSKDSNGIGWFICLISIRN